MLSAFNSLNDLMYNLSIHTPLDLLYILLRISTESLTIPSKTTLLLSLIIIELSLLMIIKISINLLTITNLHNDKFSFIKNKLFMNFRN